MITRDMRRNASYYYVFFFFFNDTATTEIYTLSLHDALPILGTKDGATDRMRKFFNLLLIGKQGRSEEHTSELQSQSNLVCRLLLEKKKIQATQNIMWRRYYSIYD